MVIYPLVSGTAASTPHASPFLDSAVAPSTCAAWRLSQRFPVPTCPNRRGARGENGRSSAEWASGWCACASQVLRLGFTHHIYNQRKFSSQTSKLRTSVHGESCHHVSHRGSNTSSQVGTVEESNSLGSCELTGENTLGRKTLYGHGGSWGRKVAVQNAKKNWGARSTCGRRGRKTMHETVARAQFAFQHEQIKAFEGLLEDEIGNMCKRQ